MPDPTTSTGTSPRKCEPLPQTILWLLEGNRAEDIADAIRAQFPQEDPKALLSSAADHFSTVADADPVVLRGWCLEAMREQYRKMNDIGDHAGALKAVKELLSYANKCSAQQQQENEDDDPTSDGQEARHCESDLPDK